MSPCWRARAACRWSSASARSTLDGHAEAIVDGEPGTVVLSPGPTRARASRERRARPGGRPRRTRRATSPQPAPHRRRHADRVLVNVAEPEELDAHRRRDLRRHRPDAHRVPVHRRRLPDEETQYRAYRRICSNGPRGKPVTIRTLDAGGDKPIPGLTIEEQNPFLGLRGIRLSLARPGRLPRPAARARPRRRRTAISRSCCRW